MTEPEHAPSFFVPWRLVPVLRSDVGEEENLCDDDDDDDDDGGGGCGTN